MTGIARLPDIGRQPIVGRVNAERIVVLGWPCAILMQVAHPLVAAGVARHSTVGASPAAPISRLRHTIRAMLQLTFGSADEQTRTIERIRTIHSRVHGVLTEDVGRYTAGTPYSACHPELVCWVHATVVRSVLLAYEALVEDPLPNERDMYCATSAPVAIALGADPSQVPRTWHQLEAYIATMVESGDLAVGREGAAFGALLLHGPLMKATGPLGWAQRVLTVGWLPPAVRGLHGLAWSPRDERQFQGFVRALRTLRRWTPDALAHWPAARVITAGRP